MTVDQQLIDALDTLWKIPPPGPGNLLSSPDFCRLQKVCTENYCNDTTIASSNLFSSFGLNNALRSLGLPCGQPLHSEQPIDLQMAAEMLVKTYTRRTTIRRHICPLDLADDLPQLSFGNTRIGRFTADELDQLFDAPRLSRHFPDSPLEARELAQFQWMIVEEEVELGSRPELRATPFFEIDPYRDLGEIKPHLGRFPNVVEEALFFLLIVAWEDWATLPEVDWRGFQIPWIYTLDEDLFVSPMRPPCPDSLTLEPCIYKDETGEDIELERPVRLPLLMNTTALQEWATNPNWEEVRTARTTDLFATPVAHFLVRAYLSDGIDEFIAHLTVIEAAFGMESDHNKKLRPKPDPLNGLAPSRRPAKRLALAIGDPDAEQNYADLFKLRSEFIHGRAEMQSISTNQRILARSLARRAVNALFSLALNFSHVTREECLHQLVECTPPVEN